MTNRDFMPAPMAIKVSFELLPVAIALDSMLSFIRAEKIQGLNEWVYQTVRSLSPETLHRHHLVLDGLQSAFHELAFEKDWASFPEFVDYLAAMDPAALRDKATDEYLCAKPKSGAEVKAPTREELLADVTVFLNWLETLWGEHGYEVNKSLFTETHALLNDPPKMQQVIVSHLRDIWENYLRDEWQRQLPTLEKSIQAYRKLDYSGLTAPEVLRNVTGREVPVAWQEKLEKTEHLVFVPSPHFGPYMWLLDHEAKKHLIFGVRMPKGTPSASAPLGRSELLVRLNALTDDTRLRILELLTEEEELCAQDIITRLELSQSSVSRHLGQLAATGFVTERRRDVAKCYSLNMERIEHTINALATFLKKK